MSAAQNIAENSNLSLEVETASGNVSISNETLNSIVEQVGTDENLKVTVEITSADKVLESVREESAKTITENVEKGNDFYWFLDAGWTPNGDLDDTIILASFTDEPEDQDKYVFEYAIIDQKGTKQITCKMPDGQPVTYQTDTVESIHFNVGKKPDEGDIEDIIFFCTITYQVAVSNSNSVTHTYTFVINPRVGDKVGFTIY